jgi:hypothetical protein
MVQHDTPSTPERTAAVIAAMMLRFAMEDIKSFGALGSDTAYVILPDGLRLKDGDLVDWLERASKPLFAVPTFAHGMIAAWPNVATPHMKHTLANQEKIVAAFRREHDLSESTTLCFDTGIEVVSFPLSHLEVWAADYVTSLGWILEPPHDGTPARIMVIAPGRRGSPGWGEPSGH